MEFLTTYFNKDEVRSFVDDEGVSWFHGTHVCRVLEYVNPRVSIPANVDECDRQKVDIGGLNDVWFINKCGLYDLILACKKPVAKPFHKWLSHTLLPSLDEKGYYIAKTDDVTLAAMTAEIEQLEHQNRLTEARLSYATDLLATDIKTFLSRGLPHLTSGCINQDANKINRMMMRSGVAYVDYRDRYHIYSLSDLQRYTSEHFGEDSSYTRQTAQYWNT
jgi:prophage antirepressor-like protein